jgi:hypothetical protein
MATKRYDPNEAINPARNLRRREEEAEGPGRITEVDAATTRTKMPETMSQADFSGYGRKGMAKPKPAPKSPRRMHSDD